MPAALLAGEQGLIPEVEIGDIPAKVLSVEPAPEGKDRWQIRVLVPEDVPEDDLLHVTVSYRGQEWNSIDINVK